MKSNNQFSTRAWRAQKAWEWSTPLHNWQEDPILVLPANTVEARREGERELQNRGEPAASCCLKSLS